MPELYIVNEETTPVDARPLQSKNRNVTDR